MSEKALNTKLLKRLRTELPGSWWYKIPDPMRCPKCGTISVVNKRPFDLIGCHKGHSIAIELKTEKAGLKSLLPHQRAELQLFAIACQNRNRSFAFIIVGSTVHRMYDSGMILRAPEDIVQIILSTCK